MPRWLSSLHTRYKDTALARDLFLSAQDRAATCQLWPPAFAWRARERAKLRSQFIDSRRSTRVATRAPRRAGCGHLMYHTTPPHRRAASLHRRKTVVRRASYDLQHTADFLLALTRARHCARCLSGRGAARTLATRARRAALVVVASHTTQGHRTSERPLSFGARPYCDVPAVASNTQKAFAWRSHERTTVLAVSREEARHSSTTRAYRAAPVVIMSRTIQGHCTGEIHLSPSAQDRAATYQLRPPTHSSSRLS